MNDFLKGLLPMAASAFGSPVAGMAVKFLADKLGVSDATQETVTKAIADAATTPEGRITLAQLDADLKKHLDDNGVRLVELSVANAANINTTMTSEASSDHWPTYSWRPAIGFAIALNVVLSTLTVLVAYVAVMFMGHESKVLEYVPGMLSAMAVLLAAPSGIVGVASYFRGKAQANPAIANDMRG